MPGLDPGIDAVPPGDLIRSASALPNDVDGRAKPGHDGKGGGA